MNEPASLLLYGLSLCLCGMILLGGLFGRFQRFSSWEIWHSSATSSFHWCLVVPIHFTAFFSTNRRAVGTSSTNFAATLPEFVVFFNVVLAFEYHGVTLCFNDDGTNDISQSSEGRRGHTTILSIWLKSSDSCDKAQFTGYSGEGFVKKLIFLIIMRKIYLDTNSGHSWPPFSRRWVL